MSELEAVKEQETPQGVRAFDQDGREVMVPREEWAANVLPGMVKQAWDQPDQLYFVVVNSLTEGFVDEMLEPAKHLYETDRLPARGACVWGATLLQLKRVDEAKAVFEGFIAEKGEDASVLVNLAKVYEVEGDAERAQATLWRSLELEPNLDVGLAWYASAAQARGGDEAANEALETLRKRPGAWRAQLWLARGELEKQNLGNAKKLYQEALVRAPKPVPPDFLMQMSGDLGSRGHLRELLELTGPHFVPEAHGMPVANNLIKAGFDLGDLDEAETIRQRLTGFNRPDWRDALTFWEGEIAKKRAAAGDEKQGIQIGMLRVDGPIWLPPGSKARSIFGAKPAGAPSVTFLGGSAEAPLENGAAIAGALGAMTRSLPLYLAEQTEMRTAAVGRAMLPWAVGATGGFVVSNTRWPDTTAVQAVQEPANRSDYVVTVHVDAEVEPWTAMLAFLRASDGAQIGEIEVEFDPNQPETELPRLADEVVELLSAFGPTQDPAMYAIPGGEHFGDYLVRLEQLLAVRCANIDGIPAQFLKDEAGILEGAFALCAAEPHNAPARLLLIETQGSLERIRPEVAAEFRERFMKLVQEHPIPELDRAFIGQP